MAQHAPWVPRVFERRQFGVEPRLQPASLGPAPASARPSSVGQTGQCDHAEKIRRRGFKNEKPAPAAQLATPSIVVSTRLDSGAPKALDSGTAIKNAPRAARGARGNPISEIKDHSGREACLGNAKEQSQRDELVSPQISAISPETTPSSP